MRWSQQQQEMKVGDLVAYTRQFLQSISCYTGDMPRAKGKVTALVAIGDVTVAEIAWDLPDLPARVNVKNLCRVNSIEYGR
jgi:hypothetical protein